jgi:hypothetical protein
MLKVDINGTDNTLEEAMVFNTEECIPSNDLEFKSFPLQLSWLSRSG